MSTQNPPVTIDHPFRPGETLAGKRVGVRYLPDTPHPLVRVRVGGSTFCVDDGDIH